MELILPLNGLVTDGFQNLGKVVGKEVKNKTKSALMS